MHYFQFNDCLIYVFELVRLGLQRHRLLHFWWHFLHSRVLARVHAGHRVLLCLRGEALVIIVAQFDKSLLFRGLGTLSGRPLDVLSYA